MSGSPLNLKARLLECLKDSLNVCRPFQPNVTAIDPNLGC
jgi:hypothetical protein